MSDRRLKVPYGMTDDGLQRYVHPGRVMRLEAENRRLREALQFYADKDLWSLPDDPMGSHTPAELDRGWFARETLEAGDE